MKTFKYLITVQVLQYFYFVFLFKFDKEIFSCVVNQHPLWQGPYFKMAATSISKCVRRKDCCLSLYCHDEQRRNEMLYKNNECPIFWYYTKLRWLAPRISSCIILDFYVKTIGATDDKRKYFMKQMTLSLSYFRFHHALLKQGRLHCHMMRPCRTYSMLP